jgi:hypothetical protein
MEARLYENYPARIVLLSSGVAISIYALGAYVLGGWGIAFSLLYLLYCGWFEVGVLRKSCVHCYYYGKVCGLGKGKLCSWLFQPGDPQRFIEREVVWRDIVPDMMVLVFPMVGGIALLIKDFTWTLTVVLLALALISMGGNAVVRGSFACKHCKQRELGCPAQELFSQRG